MAIIYPVRSEFYKLHQGLGLFKIVGGDFGTGLYFDGQPISFYWDDNRGSVAQYLARSKTLDVEVDADKVRRFVAGQIDEYKSLAKQIKPFMKMFESGEYQLNLLDLKSSQFLDETYPGQSIDDDVQGVQHFYPFGAELIASRPTGLLNQQRIKFYEDIVLQDHKPVVITTGVKDGWADFVIDGHHKLQAYLRLKIAPRVLQIIRQTSSPVTEEDVKSFLGNYPTAACHYRKHQ